MEEKKIVNGEEAAPVVKLSATDSLGVAQYIVKVLDARKGHDIKLLHVEEQTTIADYFVICTGTSATHVKALADEVEYQITEQLATEPIHKDMNDGGKWLLLDYAGVMIHVFCEQSRDFYKLERLWADGEQVDLSEWIMED